MPDQGCETCSICGGDDSCNHCHHCGSPICQSCTDAGEECGCDEEHLDEESLIDGVGFADPGGESALRAATVDNPRIFACPTCGWPNRLTGIDVKRGYQCDTCADRAEGRGD